MIINDDGLTIIRVFEGLKLKAYKCPAGIWTIGYGHTKNVKEGMQISVQDAERLLMEDIKEAADKITKIISVEINENQFSALISFVFNLGIGSFSRSTLLKLVNTSNFEAAAKEFDKWTLASGRRLDGLKKRRAAEKALFLS